MGRTRGEFIIQSAQRMSEATLAGSKKPGRGDGKAASTVEALWRMESMSSHRVSTSAAVLTGA